MKTVYSGFQCVRVNERTPQPTWVGPTKPDRPTTLNGTFMTFRFSHAAAHRPPAAGVAVGTVAGRTNVAAGVPWRRSRVHSSPRLSSHLPLPLLPLSHSFPWSRGSFSTPTTTGAAASSPPAPPPPTSLLFPAELPLPSPRYVSSPGGVSKFTSFVISS